MKTLRNTTFMSCKFKYAVEGLDRHGFLAPTTVKALKQIIKDRRWVTLWRHLNTMNGITLKVDGNNSLTSGLTDIMVIVDKAARVDALNRVVAAQERTKLKRDGICRSIW